MLNAQFLFLFLNLYLTDILRTLVKILLNIIAWFKQENFYLHPIYFWLHPNLPKILS